MAQQARIGCVVAGRQAEPSGRGYEELEMCVGAHLSQAMTSDQLAEFEALIGLEVNRGQRSGWA